MYTLPLIIVNTQNRYLSCEKFPEIYFLISLTWFQYALLAGLGVKAIWNKSHPKY